MEELLNPDVYSSDIALKIKTMGPMAISIANRWMMGWPDRVDALLKIGSYIAFLESQLDQEKHILANEANFRHLSRHEVLNIYEIRESPPFTSAALNIKHYSKDQ